MINTLAVNTYSFFLAYAQTALWSSTDEAGKALDRQFNVLDFSTAAAERMRADCTMFFVANRDDIGNEFTRAGRDFWLTRNRHGAGFWDGDWPDEIGKRLTAAAHAYGSQNIVVNNETNKLEVF